MKKSIAVLTAGLLLSTSPAHAANPYLQIHGGLFQQTGEQIDFDDQQIIDAIDSVDPDAELGFALGGLVGTYVLPFLALEGEVTMRTAQFDDVSIEDLGDAFEDDIRTVAFMGNAVFRPELRLPILPNPYIGVGAGYMTSNLDNFRNEDVDGSFAWQVKAGITFDPLPTPGNIGLEVNYIQADDFEIENAPELDVPDANFAYSGVTGLVTWKLGF